MYNEVLPRNKDGEGRHKGKERNDLEASGCKRECEERTMKITCGAQSQPRFCVAKLTMDGQGLDEGQRVIRWEGNIEIGDPREFLMA